ncbi:hypothetical protein B296_00013738 [Ensete ventricosum]|uniref:Uncharacterized protein n=1 Tax=Ensete ventricosum TaxID=4639 RepID=A0A426YYG8_ENSVE|nr:hypothetical protein B296_00013738 [Ensete ventricosum]
MTMGDPGFATGGENPNSVNILQKQFRVGADAMTSSTLGRGFGSPRCFALALFGERSCDMGPPSSAKMLVKIFCARPVSAVCASVSAEWAQSTLACVR